jgi:hypothetical protein
MRFHEIIQEAPVGDITFLGSPEPATMRADDIGDVIIDKRQAKFRRVRRSLLPDSTGNSGK